MEMELDWRTVADQGNEAVADLPGFVGNGSTQPWWLLPRPFFPSIQEPLFFPAIL